MSFAVNNILLQYAGFEVDNPAMHKMNVGIFANVIYKSKNL